MKNKLKSICKVETDNTVVARVNYKKTQTKKHKQSHIVTEENQVSITRMKFADKSLFILSHVANFSYFKIAIDDVISGGPCPLCNGPLNWISCSCACS